MALGDLATKCVAEFVGTFMLVFTVGCNALNGNKMWGGVANASVLMVAVYALGDISGANFNPAVSFCLGLCHVEAKTVAVYIVVQLAAALLATLCFSCLFWDTPTMQPADGFDVMGAALCEIFYTFMLCFVVLNVVATTDNSGRRQFSGLAIGSVIIAGAYGAGAVSGGCFNPAIALSLDVGSFGHGFGWCLAYTAFELIGAALAAGLFQLSRPEEFRRERTRRAELVSEFLGTFMLVLTVGLNVLAKSPAAAYSIAACLTAMVYALADVSGGHFNPAVTCAIFICGRERLPLDKALSYVCVQLLAGVLAAFTYSLIYGGASFDLGPGPGVGWGQVAIAETVFTFLLCYVVLCIAISATTQDSSTMFGLAIGACVAVGGNAIGSLSGGSLNPAVSFGVAISHAASPYNVYKAFLYSGFELFGASLAAGVFAVTHAVDNFK